MKHRPLIFILLALVHLLGPIIKIVSLKVATGFDYITVINNILSIESYKAIFEFWFLMPIGGFALINIRKWSYWLFVAVQVYSIISFITYEEFTWPYVNKTPDFSSLVLVGINVIIVIYFAFPQVRKPFFDEKLRWWETAYRYTINKPFILKLLDGTIIPDSMIINISRTGCFIKTKREVASNQFVIVGLSPILGKKFEVLAELKNRHFLNNEEGFGLRFIPISFLDQIRIWINVFKIGRKHQDLSITRPKTPMALLNRISKTVKNQRIP
jgi:hypothetical protein